MYNKEYAEKWIANQESGKDIFRVEHLEPAIKKRIQELPDNARILDIGCGWGMVVNFIKDNQEYVGIDPIKEFFPYIKSKFPKKKLTLLEGKLPDEINVKGDFDLVICSMVIHTNKYLRESLHTIFSKIKKRGKALVIDFSDSAENILRTKTYDPIYEEDEYHVKGIATLPSGIKVLNETFFHKEKDIENELKKYGTFTKKSLGPLFVIYDAIKK